MMDGDIPIPLFPLPSHSHTSCPPLLCWSIQHDGKPISRRKYYVCPLQCACTTAVKRHDSILGLAMRTDTWVCFPYLFDSEKEGYTKETKTTVHGKRNGWLLRFFTHINLQEHLHMSSFFLLQVHKELTMIIINVNPCFERYICNVRVLINENTEKTKEINTVMPVSCFRDKGGRHSYMWHKEGPSSRFNNSIFLPPCSSKQRNSLFDAYFNYLTFLF